MGTTFADGISENHRKNRFDGHTNFVRFTISLRSRPNADNVLKININSKPCGLDNSVGRTNRLTVQAFRSTEAKFHTETQTIDWRKTQQKNGSRASRLAKFPKCWPPAGATVVRSGRGPFSAAKPGRHHTMGAIPAVRHARRVQQPVLGAAAIRADFAHVDGIESAVAGHAHRIKCHRQRKRPVADATQSERDESDAARTAK